MSSESCLLDRQTNRHATDRLIAYLDHEVIRQHCRYKASCNNVQNSSNSEGRFIANELNCIELQSAVLNTCFSMEVFIADELNWNEVTWTSWPSYTMRYRLCVTKSNTCSCRTAVRKLEFSSVQFVSLLWTNLDGILWHCWYGVYTLQPAVQPVGWTMQWAQPSGAWAVQPGRLWRH